MCLRPYFRPAAQIGQIVETQRQRAALQEMQILGRKPARHLRAQPLDHFSAFLQEKADHFIKAFRANLIPQGGQTILVHQHFITPFQTSHTAQIFPYPVNQR